MKTYLTEIKAINPLTGQLDAFCGPDVKAESIQDAMIRLNTNGYGYCYILGELKERIEWPEHETINTRLN